MMFIDCMGPLVRDDALSMGSLVVPGFDVDWAGKN